MSEVNRLPEGNGRVTEVAPLEVVAEKEPVVRRFPGKLAAIKQRLDRRVVSAQKAHDEAETKVQEEIEPLRKAAQAAYRGFQDHCDDEYLRTGCDPERTPRYERRAEDVMGCRQLQRALEVTLQEQQEKLQELQAKLKGSSAARRLEQVREERDAWLERFLAYYGCVQKDVEWDQGTVKVYPVDSTVPSDLLEIPDEPEVV